GSCQQVGTKKVCVDLKTGGGTLTFEAIAPEPEIDIPTLQPFTTKDIKPDDSGFIYIPFLGQYMVAIFRWAVLVAGVIALALVIFGGFIYLTSGGNAQRAKQGKDRITQALFGLILLLSSYTILYIINPDLVKFESLRIKVIERQELSLEFLSDEAYLALSGVKKLTVEQAAALAKTVSTKVGLDNPCYMFAIFSTESRGNVAVVGHDEGARTSENRTKFLQSGKKYSCFSGTGPCDAQSTFTPTSDRSVKIFNDDGGKYLTGKNPPDYGLDWRFTHGFGLGQITFGGDSFCDGQRGKKSGVTGECYTIPELMNPEINATYSAHLFKFNLARAKAKGWDGIDLVKAAFYGYAAGASKIPNKINEKTNQPYVFPPAKIKGKKIAGDGKWAPYEKCMANNGYLDLQNQDVETEGAAADNEEANNSSSAAVGCCIIGGGAIQTNMPDIPENVCINTKFGIWKSGPCP
ncbi:MAG TPA: pilin, partial [Candidatus Magasanikbacteria bacterium]|nr:pilin [Candidatus Magasanikbacteria bacterium]